MSKVCVKLRDAGTIFHDSHQNVSVTGSQEVEVSLTAKVSAAIKNGVLIKVEGETVVDKSVDVDNDPNKDPEGVNTSGVVTGDLGTGADGVNTGGSNEDEPVDYSTYKRSDLIEILNTRGLEFKGNASNAELAAILTENDLANKA